MHFEKNNATVGAPARLPTQPRLKQLWDRPSASNDATVAKLLRHSKRKRYFSIIDTRLGLVPFEKNHGAASMIVNSGERTPTPCQRLLFDIVKNKSYII